MQRTQQHPSRRAVAVGAAAPIHVRTLAGAIVLAMISWLLPVGLLSTAQAAPVGQGFRVTPADLSFILKQIKIAEAHVANTTSQTGPCGALLGTGPDQLESPLLSLGLRTVDGTCNNLLPGQETFGAADQAFPRLAKPEFKTAEDSTVAGLGPVGPAGLTSYAQTGGNVVDSGPRTVSNLIVDQTSANPAAVSAAQYPVRSQGNEGVVPCDTNGEPAGCVPEHVSLDIPNVTTDVGLSPPFNSLFTIFGQFFDHGLDKITNGGNGNVFVPLKADDPLIAGPDHIAGNGDDLAADQRFMVLTRGTIVDGPDNDADGTNGRNSPNTDTPFVDQSQTYTSHSSHQVFLREYVNNTANHPVSTGKFLSSPDGGLANWAQIKEQAATLLGLELVDADVNDIPMIAADAYGKFIPGPDFGLPQYVIAGGGLVEGDRTNPVPVPSNARRIGTAFLNDIAHSAGPGSLAQPKTPDANTTAGLSLAHVASGEYDDELLDLHAICGDGRCNENIALQAVHQVFHSEHDRLIDDIKNVITTDTSGETNIADWQLALGAGGWNGERLFQAARFVTEMQYQHLVFEEFARKVQPGINPFEPFAFNQTDVNPAITAEFAHAVYRFGHSMLTDTIPRINADGSHNDIPLLDGFLNPAAYDDDGHGGSLTSAEAAGAIFMGLSDQVGQEIDEFVVDTLRNNLLGLPLDLASLNMTRARSEGVPSLNNFRKQVFEATNDGQLKPYTDWVDFGQVLKHPESLVNFVAAYGTHPIITGSLAERRTAADRIVNGTILPGPDGVLSDVAPTDVVGTVCTTPNVPVGCDESADNVLPPADSADFMFSTGAFANDGANSLTGIDSIDLWMGGLAERTNLFGGLLGSTFNYVFENQLTNLQNGDRFYYLARTPGMNLRAQLEGNSFSELVMRNTNAHTLKADPFATADCKFELENITWPGTTVGSSGKLITGVGSVQDDPASECDENEHLLRMSDGTIRYRMTNTAMPSGINAQAVYNGKNGVVVDRIWGGADNDTFWGGEGSDIVEGGDGADVALGGDGNDIITDLAGDDVPKGGPGNDAIDGGPGLDIIMGGEGNDFTNGGANTNETFGGLGDDFAIAGQGMDAVFGDSGDDWAEGGDQPDLLIGDSSSFFFDDHNLPGHDILIGQGGDDDYDLEGGDDIGVAGPGVEKTAGAAGFDWQIGVGDPGAQDMDLAQVFVAGGVILPGVRDKFNEVEALSGWNLDDKLRGDDLAPADVNGGGFVGCDALDAEGVARINGLDALIPAAQRTRDSAPIIAASATHHCLLKGQVWGEGNILLGGAGSDLLEGRGANDLLDGDRYLNVRLSVRTDPADAASEIGSTDLMENVAKSGSFGTGTSGKTLQQAVFAGLVDPGNIVAVREILDPGKGTAVDTAVFGGAFSEYVVTRNTDGTVTVAHTAPAAGGGGLAVDDGTDTLWNVERAQFLDRTIDLTGNRPATGTVTIDDTTPTENQLLTATASIADPDGLVDVTQTFTWQVESAPGVFTSVGTGQTFTPNDAQVGRGLRVAVTFTDNAGHAEEIDSALTAAVINVNDAPVGVPTLNRALPQEGELITATAAITDDDGLTGVVFRFQWQSRLNAGAFTNITGATSPTFLPTQAQVGRTVRVVVSFTDNHGTLETVNSAPTGVVGDVFVGTEAADNYTGTAGRDNASGRGGNDVLTTADADDVVSGDAGDDTINTGAGNDVVRFTGTGDGFDAVTGGAGTDEIQARANDTAIGLTSVATVETITAGSFTGVNILGSAGNNTLNLGGVTLINIGSIDGGDGIDTITGSAGDDVIVGNLGDDTLNGGAGNDTFRVSPGHGFDAVTGAAGTDTIAATANDTVIGLSSVATVESITAGSFTGVTVLGTEGNNALNLTGATLTGIGSVNAAGGADTINGTVGNDVLLGGAGSDTVNGGAGDDRITGGTENDTLNGGAGLNTFVFAAGFGADTVNSFDANPTGGQDKLDISALGITAGNFAANVTIAASGTGTLVTVTGGGSILVAGVAFPGTVANQITLADFVLAP